MLVAIDVGYTTTPIRTACVGFTEWSSACAVHTSAVTASADAEPYTPGEFYKRELPYILDALVRIAEPIEVVIVDGYVWLGPERPGLGARLHEALHRAVPVVGVAKNPFVGAAAEFVYRGHSRKPLYVTAIGLDVTVAANGIASMHGENRIPTLLKKVDQIARGIELP